MDKRFYIRRAMTDLEPHSDISQIVEDLKGIRTLKSLWAYNDQYRTANYDGPVLQTLKNLRFPWGVLSKDTEKLYPLFKELGRIYKTKKYPLAYRGVRLPKVYGTKFLAINFIPGEPISLEVKQVLENLAYGLKSWTYAKDIATNFSLRSEESKTESVVFVIQNPKVLLDGDVFKAKEKYYMAMEDTELVLCLRDPKVLSIDKVKNIYYVTIID